MLARTPVNAMHASATPDEPAALLAAWPAVAVAVGAELRDFAAERLKAQGERIRGWSHARSFADLVESELRFAAETMGTYADEMMHLQDVARIAAEVAVPPTGA